MFIRDSMARRRSFSFHHSATALALVPRRPLTAMPADTARQTVGAHSLPAEPHQQPSHGTSSVYPSQRLAEIRG